MQKRHPLIKEKKIKIKSELELLKEVGLSFFFQ